MSSMLATGAPGYQIVALVARQHLLRGDVRGETMEFKDQYKHPSWQKKRLEALEHASFACERCYDDASTLHVHHKRYVKGRMVWEYPVKELAVLCEQCHEIAHEEKDDLQNILARVHPEGYGEILSVIAGFCNYAAGPSSLDLSNDSILDRVNKHAYACGYVAAIVADFTTEQIEEIGAKLHKEQRK